MKKIIIRTAAAFILMMGIVFISPVSGQNGNPPPPPSTHGEDTNQIPGGGAPLGSGLAILLSLGAVYSGKKVFDARRKLAE